MWEVALWLSAVLFIALASFLRIRSLRSVGHVVVRPRPSGDAAATPKPPPARRLAEDSHPRQQRRRAIIERPLPEPIVAASAVPLPVPQPRSRSQSQERLLNATVENISFSASKLKDICAYGAYDPVGFTPIASSKESPVIDDDEDDPEPRFFASQSHGHNELRQIGDWNQRFQNAIQTFRGFSINTPLNERIEVNRDLIHLAQDFIYSSSTYGKIIISEVYLPDEKKMVKPLKLGMAGGDKYIVHNILFKFAVDSAGLYGSDDAAAKVAGHELKGLIQYFNTGLPELCVPLMALVDYGGFRLIAMSILPISESTIVYGSNNSGVTIHKANAQLNAIMKEAAQQLNIKEHQCGVSKATSQSLYAPADLEGHVGTDGRFYLLDFSRAMPPERPRRGVKMAHLFRLLRPEFVKSYPKPLCSDAYSGFIKEHAGAEQLNMEVSDATDHLLKVVCPAFAKELPQLIRDARRQGIALENFRLTEAIHRLGINARHMGVIRKHVVDSDTKNLLMIDMCARVIKTKLRMMLRNKMREVKAPVEEPYIRLVVSYLNLIFGSSDASEEYWSKTLRKAVIQKFDEALSDEELAPKYPFKCVLTNFSDDSMDGKFLLFARIQKMTGLHFGEKVNKELSQNRNNWLPRGAKPLDDTDLEEIGIRVKHMNIIAHAQGYFYKTLGNVHYGSDPFGAKRFFALAMEKFEEALDTDPNNPDTLCNCAQVFEKLSEEQYNVSKIRLAWADPKVQRANDYYQRALRAAPNDSYILFRYAQFFEKCQMEEQAEDFYLRSLEADPNNAACLQEYGNFLHEKGLVNEAEKFFMRASANTRQDARATARDPKAKGLRID